MMMRLETGRRTAWTISLLFWGVVGLAACENPASLEVDVTIREQGLEEIAVVVRRSSETGAKVVECQVPFDAPLEGTCPFDAGTRRWNDASQLQFVLYGTPRSEAYISIDGFRNGVSVTATNAVALLPSEPGERSKLSLALIGRTSERFRCSVDFTSQALPALDDLSAVTLFPFAIQGRIPIVASSGGRLSVIRHSRPSTEECLLEASSELLTCPLWPDSLVAAPLPDGSGAVVAGVCAAGTARIVAAQIRLRPSVEVLLEQEELGGVTGRVSIPVITRPTKDGPFEIDVVTSDPDASAGTVTLVRWAPWQRVVERRRDVILRGMRPVMFTGEIMAGPAVVPTREGGEALVVASYPGAVGIFHANEYRPIKSESRTSLFRPSVRVVAPGEFILATLYPGAGMTFTRFRQSGRLWSADEEWVKAPINDVTLAAGKAIAWGVLEDGDAESTVVTDDGIVHIYSSDPDGDVVARDLWNGAIGGPQFALLANVDGISGDEVISFSSGASQVLAMDGRGRVLDGWPISPSMLDADLRMLVADLDGVRDRDLELVFLTRGRVEVVTLGPESYDPRHLPWPMVFRDPAAQLGYRGEADPLRSQLLRDR